MNWKDLWITMFGRTNWLGLNMGFFVSMVMIVLIVILMNMFFWSLKPKNSSTDKTNETQH